MAQQSLAERMREVMTDVPGPIGDAARDAMQSGQESEMFGFIQDQPFKAASVDAPAGSGRFDVLYPAPFPAPPGARGTRFVAPGEAMSIVANTPFDIVQFDAPNEPDFILAPSEMADQFRQ